MANTVGETHILPNRGDGLLDMQAELGPGPGPGPFNVYPIIETGFFYGLSIPNQSAQYTITAEDDRGGALEYFAGGKFSYDRGTSGIASFTWQILNYDNAGGTLTGTIQVNASANETIADNDPYDYAIRAQEQRLEVGFFEGDYYCSPTGNDGANGSRAAPFGTVTRLLDVIGQGQIGVVLKGKYIISPKSVNPDGTEALPRTISGLPGEKAVITSENTTPSLNLASSTLKFYGDWWVIKNLTLRDAAAAGIYIGAPSQHVTIQNCVVHGTYMTGIQAANDAIYVTVEDCLAFDCYNPVQPGNCDGISLSGGGNGGFRHVVRRCIVHDVSDDGIDVFSSPECIVTDNIVYHTGYIPFTDTSAGNGSGFKLGSQNTGPYGRAGKNYIANNIAYDNLSSGFNNNLGMANEYYNNASFNNKIYDWRLPTNGLTYVNNIAYNSPQNNLGSPLRNERNTWNLGISNPQLLSYVFGQPGFATPALGSPCIDAGVDVGLPFNGSAPDIGAVET